MMRFSFENLGVLPKGEIELAELTVLCGANNTGKTYITYALYGLLKHLHKLSQLPSYGFSTYDTQEGYVTKIVAEYLQNMLPTALGLSAEHVVTASIKVYWEASSDKEFPSPFILSTERTGAIAFQNDLNLGKSRLLELLNQGKSVDYHAYALPIRDNIDFINSLSFFEEQTSQLSAKHPNLLTQFKDIIGGDYKLNNGVVYFQPNKNTKLRMNESSSVVRALVILGYYLKHLAKEGDLLMIDEPELNLHPANQRKLARLLVRLVNLGIKVFVTTHSDYIVKEFNTMIMLNSDSNRLQKIREKWHYTDDECLATEKVRLYTLREELASAGRGKKKRPICTVTPAEITRTLGIKVPTFDNTIDDMNAIQDEIYYSYQFDEDK